MCHKSKHVWMLPQAFPNRCTSVNLFSQMYESAVDVPGRVSLLTWSSVAMGICLRLPLYGITERRSHQSDYKHCICDIHTCGYRWPGMRLQEPASSNCNMCARCLVAVACMPVLAVATNKQIQASTMHVL
jgi:hypothetical protein